MNILLLVLIGLMCGVFSNHLGSFKNTTQQEHAYLRPRRFPLLFDLGLGIAGALAGHLLFNGRLYFSEFTFWELVFATLGGLAIIWIGRNVNWFSRV